jgi:hypothetical protein
MLLLVAVFVAPLALTLSQRMLIVPPIVTELCANAAGAANAAATAATSIFFVHNFSFLPFV